MKYLKLISLLFVAMLGSLFVSCEETAEIDEFVHWQERNEAFIDSIAKVAKANADGKWMRILSFKLDSVDIHGNPIEHRVNDYIYCHKEQNGTGDTHPLYTDLVSVNYRGRLIPTISQPKGIVFDESYKGEFDPLFNQPRHFFVDELIIGWSTALMNMVEGDHWHIYIPANLGYGSQKKGDIPAHSTLVFNLNLVNFSRE